MQPASPCRREESKRFLARCRKKQRDPRALRMQNAINRHRKRKRVREVRLSNIVAPIAFQRGGNRAQSGIRELFGGGGMPSSREKIYLRNPGAKRGPLERKKKEARIIRPYFLGNQGIESRAQSSSTMGQDCEL